MPSIAISPFRIVRYNRHLSGHNLELVVSKQLKNKFHMYVHWTTRPFFLPNDLIYTMCALMREKNHWHALKGFVRRTFQQDVFEFWIDCTSVLCNYYQKMRTLNLNQS